MEYTEDRGDYRFFFDTENMGTKKYSRYECTCGETGQIRNDNIKDSYVCKHPKKYMGMTKGRWTVIGTDKREDGCSLLVCQCSCENKTIRKIPMSAFTHDKTMSCGCLHYETMRKENTIITNGNTSEIHIKDQVVLIDTEDVDLIKQYCWCINGTSYVIAWDSNNEKMIDLSRLIMNPPDDKIVDHRNGDTLNNKKENLRIVECRQNNMNKCLPKNNTSGHKGVHWHKFCNKWIASIGLGYKLIHLGYFSNYEDAVKAREEAEERYFGKYKRDKEHLVKTNQN